MRTGLERGLDARLEAWIRLVQCDGLTPRLLHGLLREFGSAEAILDASHASIRRFVPASVCAAIASALVSSSGSSSVSSAISSSAAREGSFTAPQADDSVAATLAWAAEDGNHLLTWDDPRYPRALLELTDPPPLLFCKGDPSWLNAPSLAMVGSRNASPGGLQTAEAFAEAFAASGISVVSGLALGIDAAAHRGALKPDAGPGVASTIAVIGTGIDRVYPPRNRDLAHAIAERGAIVSEFPLGTPPLNFNFPRRNRLISGLSRGVLVVEAALNSGSLITARFAGEQGKDVFAIPGSIHSPFSKGCHRLIKEGAKLVETAHDVLEELRWPGAVSAGSPVTGAVAQTSATTSTPAAGADGQAVLDAVGFDPVTTDEVAARTGWPIDRVLTTLLHLELAGTVKPLPGGRLQRLS